MCNDVFFALIVDFVVAKPDFQRSHSLALPAFQVNDHMHSTQVRSSILTMALNTY